MRKLVLLVSTLAVACGGGGGSGGGGGLSGTVGGKAFTPLEVKAIPADTSAGACTITPPGGPTISVGVKAIALQITSYANACNDFATSTCQLHMGAQTVTVLVAKVNPLGTVPALPPGTYTLYADPTTTVPDGSGMLNVGFAQAMGTNATCMGTPSVPSSGTIRLDGVGDPVTGHVSVAFKDGSTLEGDFSAPACAGVHPDICQLASSGSICTGAHCGP